MRLAHHTTIVTLFLIGTAWGLCLVLAGLHALTLGWRGGRPEPLLLMLGFAGLAAGNFVFMEVVADRVLLGPRRWPRDAAEIVAATVMIASLAAAGVIWFTSTLP